MTDNDQFPMLHAVLVSGIEVERGCCRPEAPAKSRIFAIFLPGGDVMAYIMSISGNPGEPDNPAIRTMIRQSTTSTSRWHSPAPDDV